MNPDKTKNTMPVIKYDFSLDFKKCRIKKNWVPIIKNWESNIERSIVRDNRAKIFSQPDFCLNNVIPKNIKERFSTNLKINAAVK